MKRKQEVLMKRLFAVVLLFSFLLMLTVPTYGYVNPVHLRDGSGNECPAGDPFVMKFNGTYYCYVSGGNCFRSNDLINWTFVGNAFAGEHAENLYAPEVFYWNGSFYCISCPDGTTNYRFRSDRPEGPFTVESDALGGGIDGSLFRDDDGTIYFTHAEWNGIALYRMKTPESEMVSLGTIPTSVSGMWTEGPGIFKRNGKYYMTYCGNHVLDPAYRVEYAVSDSISSGWSEPEQNLLLLSTEGTLTGLGHNSVVIGPDLDTYYIVYHNRFADGTQSVDRSMNLQRILWNGDQPVVALAEGAEENPMLPEEEYRPANGTAALQGQILTQRATSSVFTAEFHLIPETAELLFGYTDEQNYCCLRLDGQRFLLEKAVNGSVSTESAVFPENTATDVLQSVRIQQTEDALCVYLAGGLLLRTEPTTEGGKIGYRAENGTVGYLAFSDVALGSRDAEAEKYPYNTYPASLANQTTGGIVLPADTEPGNALLMNAGDRADFTLHVNNAGAFYGDATLTLRGHTDEETRINVYLDGELFREQLLFAPCEGNRTEILRGLSLAKRGDRILTVEVVSGSFTFYEMATAKELDVREVSFSMDRKTSGIAVREGEGTFRDGEFVLSATESPKGDCFAKTILGSSGYGDYAVEVRLRLESTANDAEAGIFLRSANESDGEAAAFRFRRKWYQQCYYVCVRNGFVSLYKQDYGETLLAQYRTSADFTKDHLLKISAQEDLLTVWLDGEEILQYTDQNHPYSNGRCGMKVVNGTAFYDDFSVIALSSESENSGTNGSETLPESTGAESTAPNAEPAKAGCRSQSGAGIILLSAVLLPVCRKRKKRFL